MGSRKLGYRPALDGLRAISVLAVLFYHAGISWMPGGFLGVEVFFVVSGFLITSLLLEERLHDGAIDLRHFWVRRARRLLPALYLLLFVVIVAALTVYRDAAARLGGDTVAALFYVSNWWNIWLQESYFAQAGRPPLLRHLWSLAVEEQFYILFPPLFALALQRFRMVRIQTVLIVVSIASAVLMAVLFEPYTDPSRVYYGTDTRAAGMLVGALLATAWAPWRSRQQANPRAGLVLDVVGAAAGLGLLMFLRHVNEFDAFIYRGGFLLLDVVCIVLIAVLVHPSARLASVLSFKPLVWVGVRSYAIYLWHWPIFQVTRPELDIPLTGLPLFALRMTLTIVAAEVSYRLVEQPFRGGLLGRWWKRLRTGSATQQLYARRQMITFGTSALVVVLLLSAGLVQASTDSARHELEVSAHMAPPLDDPDVGPDGSNTYPTVVTVTTGVDGQGDDAGPDSTVDPEDPPAESTTTTVAPTAGDGVVAVGDSVMLGASIAIRSQLPGIRLDAKVGRQFNQLLSVVDWYNKNGYLSGPVVVHLGTNGIFSDADLDRLVAAAGDRRMVIVNAKVARPWEGLANQRIAAVGARHPNVVVADWHALSSAHPEWFASDGVHLRPDGAAAFAGLIDSSI